MQTNRNHQKHFKNYRANKVVWAAQLRKGNFKDMVEGLKYHGATGKVVADLEKYTITFNAHNAFSEANGTVNLGDFIIFENSGPIIDTVIGVDARMGVDGLTYDEMQGAIRIQMRQRKYLELLQGVDNA